MKAPSPEKIYSNVANCAFQRWAQLITSLKVEDRLRAEEEMKTAYMALELSKSHSRKKK